MNEDFRPEKNDRANTHEAHLHAGNLMISNGEINYTVMSHMGLY